MTCRAQVRMRWLILLGAGGSMFQLAGCARIVARELEVLFAANANPTLIGGSFLADLLGPGLLTLFN